MARKRYEAQLEAVDELRHVADPALAVEPLTKALRDHNNYLVGRAARVVAALALADLIPQMLAALERFYAEGSDAQCWAKNALVDALAELGHGDSAVYLRGLKHVQMEAVWGGRVDTAGPLRARCAVALVSCRELRDTVLLGHLVEALADPEKAVRAEAAKAIGRVERAEAALLVRLKALVGDVEPEVLGACFSAVLGIEGKGGIAFVRRFLDGSVHGDAAAEAALALGMTRSAEALAALRDQVDRERDPLLLAAVLTGVALTGLAEANEFLIGLVARGGRGSLEAVEALGSARLSEEERQRLWAVAEADGGESVRAAVRKKFGAER